MQTKINPVRYQPLPVLINEHQSLDALRGPEGLCCLQAGAQHLVERAQYRHHRLLRQRPHWLTLTAAGQVGHQVGNRVFTC